MFDKLKLNNVIVQYKKDFIPTHWEEEKFKWEAVKCFQDNWDVNAKDFADMLSRSLSMTYSLLVSKNNFPAKMIIKFANTAPAEVRSMYIELFDEKKDMYDRINSFKERSSVLLKKYGDGAKQHYQYENAITTYLWLRFPDKYYIYKFSDVKTVSNVLKSNYIFKRGAYNDNIFNFYKFYNEICEELQNDKELVDIFKSQLTETCYPDDELKTLTYDVGLYISRYYSNRKNINIKSNEEWWPQISEYDPGLTTQDWLDLLNDKKIFTDNSLKVMRRLKDYGGAATCTQLSLKYGASSNFYNTNSSSLAKRVYKKTGCSLPPERDSVNSRWWPILYVGKYASKKNEGIYIWKLRDELSEALNQFDLSDVELYVKPYGSLEEHRYWWLNANPKIWSFSDLQVGETQFYTLYNENGHKRRIFQNFVDAKPGDPVIGYEANPIKKIVALARVSKANDGDKIGFEKTESLASPIDYQDIKNYPELNDMEFLKNLNGSFFKLTKHEYEFIMDIVREENPLKPGNTVKSYTKSDFLSEVYMSEQKYEQLAGVLLNKKNIILQGAPGVGKTFCAKRLAYSIMGEKDDDRVQFVQFHQNYSYEDFIMGFKPSEDGFELKYGIFYRFCQKAANQPEKNFFFIIDEINRGNLSKIFGELLMLIEKDYRGIKATMAYDGILFTVPKNLYIIGMMNTADRSLALIDYALRRRFSFFEIKPAFESKGFADYQKSLNSECFNELISKIVDLNNEISHDKSLGESFCIGHSYFCGQTQDTCTKEWMQSIVDYDIIPMLSEYWFDDNLRVEKWANILHGVLK